MHLRHFVNCMLKENYIELGESIAYLDPEIAGQWHPTKKIHYYGYFSQDQTRKYGGDVLREMIMSGKLMLK